MRVEANSRVVVDYTLRDRDGQVLDESSSEGGEPIEYVHGYGMIVPGLEMGLLGLEPGAKKTIVVAPEEGFGDRDEDLVIEVDRSEVPNPKGIAIGDELVLESPDGEELSMRVVAVTEDGVTLDGNHPLAGETLYYQIEVREVRPATEYEIAEAASAFEEAEAEDLEGGAEPELVQLGRKPRK